MSMQRGNTRGDDLGVMVPLGGSGGEKEMIRFNKEVERMAPAASTLIRGRIRENVRGLYGLAASLAGNHEPTQAFIANMIAAGLGESGFARSEFLMGLSRMLVPTSMPAAYRTTEGQAQRKHPSSTKQPGNGRHEDDE